MSASAGRVLLIPKGDYDSSVTYNMLDMVFYGGKTYVCKQTSTGNAPTNTVYWQIMLDGASTFDALTDVQINNVQDGDSIYWDSTAQKWKNTTPIGIVITSPPAKTDYASGDILDLTGIVVMAEYSSGTTRNITTECTFSPTNGATLTPSDTSVTVSWHSFTATQLIDVAQIYGVEWDGSASPVWTRTDAGVGLTDPVSAVNNGDGSSPFDNIKPWSEMVRVEDANAGTLVKIPKFYYKWTRNGASMKLQVSSGYFDGALVSPAHADRGDGHGERDVVYVGAYHNDSNYQSKTGVTPRNSTAWATCRTNIHALGSDIWQYDFAMYWTIGMLYLVEYANWKQQATIGRGDGVGGSLTANGATDNMIYHTGTSASTRSTAGHVRYRYIEDLWANLHDFIDGAYANGASAYCIKNPASFGNSGGTLVGTTFTSQSNIKEFTNPSESGFEYALFPSAVGGTYGVDYTCSLCSLSTSANRVYTVGSSYGNSTDTTAACTMFSIYTMSQTDPRGWHGSRLMKLP